jgi:pimeloyl-ACP methyl ester carboxylesterase
MTSTPLFRAAAVGAAVLSLAACGGSSSSSTPAPTPTAVVPRLDESSCPYKFDASQKLGTTVRCGVLIAAQDRRVANGATIRIPFVVFKPATASTLAPVVYLTGGPGDTWADDVGTVQASQSPGFAGGAKLPRDEVVIEQRGSSATTPALACKAVAWGPEMFRDSVNALAAALPGVKSCADGLTASSVRPENFNTNELAADVEDLRRLLGYNKVVLNGVSYGTNWALAVLRNHPNSVDSVVLDSVVSPAVYPLRTSAEGIDAAFTAIAATCAAQASCAADYPDLNNRVSALFAALNAKPIPWTAGPGGELTSAVLFGTLMTTAMFTPEDFPGTVAAFEELLAAGVSADELPADQQAALIEIARENFDSYAGPSAGQYWSIVCADNATTTQAEVDAAALRVRPALQPVAKGALNALYSSCQAWPYRKDLPASTFAPVASGVRVLLLSGALDPSTPAAWAKDVAKTLTNSTLVSFPARGHALQGSSTCANGLVTAFLAGQTVNPACAAAETVDFQ